MNSQPVKVDASLPTSDMLTLPEVAARLRMSVHTLRRPELGWLGRLGAVKVAGKWLVTSDAVNDVLTGRR